MSNELDDILNEATSIDDKKPVKLVKADRGGALKKQETKETLEATRMALERRPLRVGTEGYKNLEDAIGGRQSLIETLKFCPASSFAHKSIQKLLVDAALQDINTSLAALCYKNKVRFESLVLAFKDALTAKLAVTAITRLTEASDEVFEQVSIHALDRFDTCPVCVGKTRVRRINDSGEWAKNEQGEFLTQLCYNCRGTGKVFKEHDIQDRKVYLEIIGVLASKGINVNNIQQNAVIGASLTPGDGSFERLIKAVDLAVGHQKTAAEDDIIDLEVVAYEDKPSDPA